MALAWAIAMPESMVLEKLFQEDQPMGGRGTAICLAPACALKNPVPLRNMATNKRTSPAGPGPDG